MSALNPVKGRGQRRSRRHWRTDPYLGLGALDAWRKWFKDSGLSDFWSRVECIECELNRRCLKEPPCADAILDDCEKCGGEVVNNQPHNCANWRRS